MIRKINQMNEYGEKMKINDDNIMRLTIYDNNEISRSNNKTTKIIEINIKSIKIDNKNGCDIVVT